MKASELQGQMSWLGGDALPAGLQPSSLAPVD
jgi:hypothetical protein